MLTKTQIDKAKPKDRVYVLWDGDLPGFGCRVYPTGRRTFIIMYRVPGTKRSGFYKIGTYGSLTVDQARKEAKAALYRVSTGVDPQSVKTARKVAEAAEKARLTVTKLVAQYQEALTAGTITSKRLRGRSPADSYVRDTLRHLTDFATTFGEQDAAAITSAKIRGLLAKCADRPSTHRHLHGAIHRMYRWAQQHELVANNPAGHIETTTAAARERVLSLGELGRIWHAAATLPPLYRDALHLLVISGQRRAEVAGMMWGEVDLDRALWTLPAAKTKARRQHVVPLAPLGVDILKARRDALPYAPAPNDLVLPTATRDGEGVAPISGWNWLKRELDRKTGLTDWRLHDFRRSIVSVCAEHGADIAVLDTLLNHAASATRGGVIGVYQRATLVDRMHDMMKQWDRLLREALANAPMTNVPPALAAD